MAILSKVNTLTILLHALVERVLLMVVDYLRRCGNLVDWEDLSEYEEVEVTPKYKVGDKVIFKYVFDFNTIVGVVQVVDTFPNSTIVDYDILNEQEPCLYKHVNEKDVVGKYED